MSDITKTEAVVLNKLEYSDSSLIAALYTKSEGRMSAIVKGGRSKNSKVGRLIDPMNVLDLVLYIKPSREVQIISSADLITYHKNILEDYDKLKYSYAVLELVKNYMLENEVNERLYNGIKRILGRFDTSAEHPGLIFSRFFIFFLGELGYDLQIEECTLCGRQIKEDEEKGFEFMKGIVCNSCLDKALLSAPMSKELFGLLMCLKTGKKTGNVETTSINYLLKFLDKYLRMHVENYTGLKSLSLD